MMGVPLSATFDSSTETLTISYKEDGSSEADGEQQQSAGSAAGRRRSFQQRQRQHQDGGGGGSSSGGGGAQDNGQEEQEQPSVSAQLGLNNESFNLELWLAHMQGTIVNRQHIRKAVLPLQIKQFTQFPVVASSYSNRITQSVEDLACKLWIPCSPTEAADAGGEEGGGAGGIVPAAAPAASAGVVLSAMALETLYED